MPWALLIPAGISGASWLAPKEHVVEFVNEVCGIYFRSILLKEANTFIEQHTHDHDHATYIGSGEVRVWINGKMSGDFEAGLAIPVEAGKHHSFMSLKPNTRLTCVHVAESAESAKRK